MLYIIITYNGEKYIKRCIESIFQHNPESEIWIHDNGSTDSTLSIINSLGITTNSKSTNLGFGAANNLGFKHFMTSNHHQCFLLNQDAYLTESTTNAFPLIQSYPNSIIAPLQLTGAGLNFDEYFKNNYLHQKHCPDFLEDAYFKRVKKAYPISFAPAAAWIIPKSVILKIGGFNPSFFHYGEDSNYIQRCEYHGVKMYLAPNSVVLHDRENRPKDSVHKTKNKSKERALILQLSNPTFNGQGIKSRFLSITRYASKYPISSSQLTEINNNRRISQGIGLSFI